MKWVLISPVLVVLTLTLSMYSGAAQGKDGAAQACGEFAMGATVGWPEAKLAPLRAACESDPDPRDCPDTYLVTQTRDRPDPLNCFAANKTLKPKKDAEEQARIAEEQAQNAPYDMSTDDTLKAQTALIECYSADLGLPNGKFDSRTKAAIAKYTRGEVFNKDRFDSLVAGCPEMKFSFAAASIATDGKYSAVSGFSSAVAALKASIDGCRAKSSEPDSCISIYASSITKCPDSGICEMVSLISGKRNGLAVGECSRGQKETVFLRRSFNKVLAKSDIYDNFSSKGFKRAECKILAVLDPFGVDE